MKTKIQNFISFLLLTVGLVTVSPARAQVIDQSTGEVVWLGSTLSEALQAVDKGEHVYLYNVATGTFLNSGGNYGVQGVLSTVGMRLTFEASTSYNNAYRIRTRIGNNAQGDCVSPNGTTSTPVYLDRKDTYTDGAQYSRPDWRFTNTSGNQRVNGQNHTTNTYTLLNVSRNAYLGTNGNNTVLGNNNLNWRIVTESDYEKAMNSVVWGQVDLGAFVKDPEFSRDSKDARYWEWVQTDENFPVRTAKDFEGENITLDYPTRHGSGNSAINDFSTYNSQRPHWHQRNQNVMCNNVDMTTTRIYRTGNNGYGTNLTGNNYYDLDGFRAAFGQYYAAEIYNEKIRLQQTATLTAGANLSEGLYKFTCQGLYYDDENGYTNGNAYFFVTRSYNGDVSTQRLPLVPMNSLSGNNITPHSGVSAGYVFDNNANAYLLQFYIEVKAGTQLTFGIETTEAKGWACLGNIHLYAHGRQAVFIDEDWTTQETLTHTLYHGGDTQYETGDPYVLVHYQDKYDFPVTVYYQRTMALNKWNSICLPVSLTGDQIYSAFGGDTELAVIDKLYPNSKRDLYLIDFKSVPVSNGITMGKTYIIKPSSPPQYPDGITLEVGNGGTNQIVTIDGPTYAIGIMGKNALPTVGSGESVSMSADFRSLKVDNGDGIHMAGSYYKIENVKDLNGTSTSNTHEFLDNNEMWMITKGNMVHLTDNSKTVPLYATYAFLYAEKDVDFTQASIQMLVDGLSDGTTAIDDLPILTPSVKGASVYNLSGQRVCDVSEAGQLPKGVYLIQGRKFTVK